MGEFELIRRYFDRARPNASAGPGLSVRLGIGDDCALLQPGVGSSGAAGAPDASRGGAPLLAVSTDMLVAGRHFFDDVDAESLGHKALAVNLSDLAAMGATPRAFTLALALPKADPAWLEAFARGMFALADVHGAELVGGDTTRGPLNVCITVFGDVEVAGALRRDRARANDDLWVSGALGAAAWAVRRRLAGTPLPPGHPALERLDRPTPRVALGQALCGVAHAAIDLSDGLVGDLRHVLDRSGVGAELDVSAVPIAACLSDAAPGEQLACALAGGDDYELAFTAPRLARDAVGAAAAGCVVPVTRIGRIVGAAGLRLHAAADVLAALPADLRAHDHFARA